VNKAIQRSLTKAVARHGLGLYIYAGEDLPETTVTTEEATALMTLLKGKFTDEQIEKTLEEGYKVKKVEELSGKQYAEILRKVKGA
jgi:hypothetical protein